MLTKALLLIVLPITGLLALHASQGGGEDLFGTTELDRIVAAPCEGLCCAPDELDPAGPPVAFGARLGQGVLAPGRVQDVYMVFELQAVTPDTLPPRPALNMALVLDRSGSMSDAGKLDYAKLAALDVAEGLAAGDRLAVVAYDTSVQVVWPSSAIEDVAPSGAVGMSELVSRVQALTPGSSTNLHGGLLGGGQQVLQHAGAERMNRVLLLSDGLANVGLSSAGELGAEARKARELGMQISTVGLGLQYDEELMAAVATEGGGRYAYVRDAEHLSSFVQAELEHASRIVARDVELSFALGDGVQVTEVFGSPVHVQGGEVRIPLEDLVAGETRQVLVELSVRTSSGAAEGAQLALLEDIELGYTARTGAETEARAQLELPPRTVTLSSDAQVRIASQDRAVRAKLEVVRAALFMDEAIAQRETGDWEGAAERLAEHAAEARRLNDQVLGCSEVEKVIGWMERRAADMLAAAGDWASGRDVDLRSGLESMGYL